MNTDQQTATSHMTEKLAINILESISDAVIATDLSYRVVGWNKAAEQLYGWMPDEVQGKKVNTILRTQTTPTELKNMRQALIKTGHWKGDVTQLKRDDSPIQVTSSVSLIKDIHNKPILIVAINRDNTERKHVEEVLQYKAEISKILPYSRNYRETLEAVARLAVPRIADWCSIHLINKEAMLEQITLFPKQSTTLSAFEKFRMRELITVLQTRRPAFFPSLEKMSGGLKLKSSSIIIVPLIVENQAIGAITLVLTTSHRHYTKTDLQIAEQIASRVSIAIENVKLIEAVDKERNRLTTLLTTVPGVVWESWGNPDTSKQRIDFVSKHVEKMLGYDTQQWLTTPNFWLTIVHPDDRQRAGQEAASFFKKGTGGTSRFRWLTKTGESIWVEAHSSIVKDRRGKPIGMRGVTMDISDRMALENRKDEFLGIASHELRTPLTSIKGYIQILERQVQSGATREQIVMFLKRIDIYTDRLNDLINDLLDASKIQAGKLRLNKSKFSVDEMIGESIDSIQPTSPSHQIIFKGRTNITITGDKIRLEQVVTNLLSNAIKYSPKADRITVSTASSNNHVHITVRDYGIGIPKDKHPLLFQRFYRVEDTERKFSGMGIGLYISHEIVQRHHGSISVKSDGKRGTTFEVTLPIQS